MLLQASNSRRTQSELVVHFNFIYTMYIYLCVEMDFSKRMGDVSM